MTGGTRDILCDSILAAARDGHLARLRALYAGRALEHAFVLNGILGEAKADPYVEPQRWVAEALDDLAAKSEKSLDPEVFRPLVVEFEPYGVHFVDRIFGAEVLQLEGNWQARLLGRAVGVLEPPDIWHSDTWLAAQRVAEAFLDARVTAPLFGLPVIASALNVAVNLYGQDLLAALCEKPDAGRHDLAVINDALREMHRWYLRHVPLAQLQPVVSWQRTQPPGFGQLCGCSTQLVSGETYREFIAPLDDALLSTYPMGGMIHLCGTHTQHIPAWRGMKSLRAVQLNDRASEDLSAYFSGLRTDQVLYVNPCKNMPVERIMAVTRGERVVIVTDTVEPLRRAESCR